MRKPSKIIYDKSKSVVVEDGYIVDNYLDKSYDVGYSMVRTHLNGKHPWMKNKKSNRTYYLINGYATFSFEDNKIELKEGEMLVIPNNTKYSFEGEFDAILVDSPAFDPIDDVIYKD